VLLFFFLQLLLEMGMAQHVVLTEPVHFEIRVICNLEPIVDEGFFYLHFLGHFLIHQFFHFLFSTLEDVGLFQFIL
jgi:hypothetical protein